MDYNVERADGYIQKLAYVDETKSANDLFFEYVRSRKYELRSIIAKQPVELQRRFAVKTMVDLYGEFDKHGGISEKNINYVVDKILKIPSFARVAMYISIAYMILFTSLSYNNMNSADSMATGIIVSFMGTMVATFITACVLSGYETKLALYRTKGKRS